MEWTNEQLIETARVISKYENEKAAQLLNELATRLDCALVATRTACAERDALAAENAGLKSFGDKLNEMHENLNGTGTGIQGGYEVTCQQLGLEAAMEEFDAIKTPATDRFIADVKAQGVELAVQELESIDTIAGTRVMAFKLRGFAQQLRGEEKV